MKKSKRKPLRLRSRSSDEEIIRWAKTHDVFDQLEAGVSELVEDHSDLDQVLKEAIPIATSKDLPFCHFNWMEPTVVVQFKEYFIPLLRYRAALAKLLKQPVCAQELRHRN